MNVCCFVELPWICLKVLICTVGAVILIEGFFVFFFLIALYKSDLSAFLFTEWCACFLEGYAKSLL